MNHILLCLWSLQSPAAPIGLDPVPAPAAEEQTWKAGARFHVWTGFGSVYNDLAGFGVDAAWRADPEWWVRLGFQRFRFDFEDPQSELFGVSEPETADASLDLTVVDLTAEWHLDLGLPVGTPFDLYAGAGLGLARIGDGEASKGAVDIDVDGGRGFEAHLVAGGSVRVWESVRAALELKLTRAFVDVDATDRNTGEEETEEGFTAIGASIGVEVRF